MSQFTCAGVNRPPATKKLTPAPRSLYLPSLLSVVEGEMDGTGSGGGGKGGRRGFRFSRTGNDHRNRRSCSGASSLDASSRVILTLPPPPPRGGGQGGISPRVIIISLWCRRTRRSPRIICPRTIIPLASSPTPFGATKMIITIK